jgi:hypothetical protein
MDPLFKTISMINIYYTFGFGAKNSIVSYPFGNVGDF